jgi:rubrerythrin
METDSLHASVITSHAFEPKGAWYTLCLHCNLGEAAHRTTTVEAIPADKQSDPNDADAKDLPQWSGNTCSNCGVELIRTGDYETCPSCGEMRIWYEQTSK